MNNTFSFHNIIRKKVSQISNKQESFGSHCDSKSNRCCVTSTKLKKPLTLEENLINKDLELCRNDYTDLIEMEVSNSKKTLFKKGNLFINFDKSLKMKNSLKFPVFDIYNNRFLLSKEKTLKIKFKLDKNDPQLDSIIWVSVKDGDGNRIIIPKKDFKNKATTVTDYFGKKCIVYKYKNNILITKPELNFDKAINSHSITSTMKTDSDYNFRLTTNANTSSNRMNYLMILSFAQGSNEMAISDDIYDELKVFYISTFGEKKYTKIKASSNFYRTAAINYIYQHPLLYLPKYSDYKKNVYKNLIYCFDIYNNVRILEKDKIDEQIDIFDLEFIPRENISKKNELYDIIYFFDENKQKLFFIRKFMLLHYIRKIEKNQPIYIQTIITLFDIFNARLEYSIKSLWKALINYSKLGEYLSDESLYVYEVLDKDSNVELVDSQFSYENNINFNIFGIPFQPTEESEKKTNIYEANPQYIKVLHNDINIFIKYDELLKAFKDLLNRVKTFNTEIKFSTNENKLITLKLSDIKRNNFTSEETAVFPYEFNCKQYYQLFDANAKGEEYNVYILAEDVEESIFKNSTKEYFYIVNPNNKNLLCKFYTEEIKSNILSKENSKYIQVLDSKNEMIYIHLNILIKKIKKVMENTISSKDLIYKTPNDSYVNVSELITNLANPKVSPYIKDEILKENKITFVISNRKVVPAELKLVSNEINELISIPSRLKKIIFVTKPFVRSMLYECSSGNYGKEIKVKDVYGKVSPVIPKEVLKWFYKNYSPFTYRTKNCSSSSRGSENSSMSRFSSCSTANEMRIIFYLDDISYFEVANTLIHYNYYRSIKNVHNDDRDSPYEMLSVLDIKNNIINIPSETLSKINSRRVWYEVKLEDRKILIYKSLLKKIAIFFVKNQESNETMEIIDYNCVRYIISIADFINRNFVTHTKNNEILFSMKAK